MQAPPGARPRPWLPPSWPVPADRQGLDTRASRGASIAPSLAFDEAEMARVAAAVRVDVEREVRAVCAAEPPARRARALERIARSLGEAIACRETDARATTQCLVALAEAIARAAAAVPSTGPAGVADIVVEMLTLLEGPRELRIVVDLAAVEALRPILPEIAARAGYAGTVELSADPALPDGAVQLLWSGGWLEHDPGSIARRIETLLAPFQAGAAGPPAATDLKVTIDDAEPT